MAKTVGSREGGGNSQLRAQAEAWPGEVVCEQALWLRRHRCVQEQRAQQHQLLFLERPRPLLQRLQVLLAKLLLQHHELEKS